MFSGSFDLMQSIKFNKTLQHICCKFMCSKGSCKLLEKYVIALHKSL